MAVEEPGRWRSSGVVSLLTDFGARDTYVGVMKGVLYRTEPGLRGVVDLTHAVAPQDVRSAAFHLRHSWRWFPPGTVHVAVVDPGVGSERRVLCASFEGHAFLAPDNGLLGPVLGEGARVFAVDAERWGLPRASRTFHGRDVFAPAAARVAGGVEPGELGPPAEGWQRLAFPEPRPREGGGFEGEVLSVDHFGNLVTNLPGELARGAGWSLSLSGRVLPVRGTYAEAAPGECLALIDSYGLLEVAVRDGNAAQALGLSGGAPVALTQNP